MPVNLYDTWYIPEVHFSMFKNPIPCTFSSHLMEPVSQGNSRDSANIQVNNNSIYLLFSLIVIFALLVTDIAVCYY